MQGSQPPQFGRQRMHLLENGVLIRSTSEVIRARSGESTEAFLRRLVDEYHVGPQDVVEVTFKSGLPDYAVVEWAG